MTTTKGRAGPKAAVDVSALPMPKARLKKSLHFNDFARTHLRIASRTGPVALRPRKWQLELVGSVFDRKQPRLAGWMMPRGQGKTALCAALALWELFTGQYAANVVIAAVDERQAGLMFDKCVYMVEHSPELAARAQIFRDKIVVPGRDASLRTITSEEKRIQGLDFSMAFLDEAGFASNEVFGSLLDSQGKRETSSLILIGTPGTVDSPLERTRADALANPDDDSLVWREFSADDFKDHPWDCAHCLKLSNPSYGDFLFKDGIAKPPRVTENRYRLVRLCQFVGDDAESYLAKALWQACRDDSAAIPAHAQVCIGLDGSRSDDATAVVAVTVEAVPRVQVLGLWEPRLHDSEYRVPVPDVMDTIRDACRRYEVVEVACDPYGFSYPIELLRSEGLPMVEFPNSLRRMAEPVSAFRDAVVNAEVRYDGTHALADKLTQHVTNAVVKEHSRGLTIAKPAFKSARKIDALAATLMAYDRARWNFNNKPESNDWYVF